MAPKPSSWGISRSMVTASGSYWCTLRRASRPSRAVATTRNSPAPPAPPSPSTSLSTRRIRALSSTTSTLGRRSDEDGISAHRSDFGPPVGDVEAYRASRPAADGGAFNGDTGVAQGVAHGQDVAFPHLHGAGGHELREHTGAARELGDEAARVGAELGESRHEQRHRRFGELGGVRGVARQAAGGEEDVSHRSPAHLGVVQHDGHAGPQSQRDQARFASFGGPLPHPHHPLPPPRPPPPLPPPH